MITVIIILAHLPKYFNENSCSNVSCPEDCENYIYEVSMVDRPYEKDGISMDIFFDRRPGIRYKRVIVVTKLDMLGNILHLNIFYAHIY